MKLRLFFTVTCSYTEAVQRITGAYVAHMRPPYGNYNQMVLDAAGIRGQSVITWDFEYVLSSENHR